MENKEILNPYIDSGISSSAYHEAHTDNQGSLQVVGPVGGQSSNDTPSPSSALLSSYSSSAATESPSSAVPAALRAYSSETSSSASFSSVPGASALDASLSTYAQDTSAVSSAATSAPVRGDTTSSESVLPNSAYHLFTAVDVGSHFYFEPRFDPINGNTPRSAAESAANTVSSVISSSSLEFLSKPTPRSILTESNPLNSPLSESLRKFPQKPPKVSGGRDWNEQFQHALEQDEAHRLEQLSSVAHDFVSTAMNYGKIIITEFFLDKQEKTIPPKAFGGVAGGDKFLCQGILFKIAKDVRLVENPPLWMYGGSECSDEKAQKGAGHELKGLVNIRRQSQALDLHLCTPLMALIDYRGFRLIAMSLLPIGKSSLVLGSADGGANVKNDSPQLHEAMLKLGQALNIREHEIGSTGKKLVGPGDLEGHSGTDSRFYLLDFARLLPPEAPEKFPSRSPYYNLLRAEFIRKYPTPLCADAFSGWVKGAPNMQEYNADVRAATQHLFDVTIPQSSAELAEEVQYETTSNFSLTNWLHRHGINMRHLGKFRTSRTIPQWTVRAPDEYLNAAEFIGKSVHWHKVILAEMIARTVKCLVKRNMRELARTLVDEPYRLLIVNMVNILVGCGAELSKNFWNISIKDDLTAKFGVWAMNEEEKHHDFNLSKSVHIPYLWRRMQSLLGIRISSRVTDIVTKQKILGTNPKDIVDWNQGRKLLENACKMIEQLRMGEAQSFLTAAHEKFLAALATSPADGGIFVMLAKIEWYKLQLSDKATSAPGKYWLRLAALHLGEGEVHLRSEHKLLFALVKIFDSRAFHAMKMEAFKEAEKDLSEALEIDSSIASELLRTATQMEISALQSGGGWAMVMAFLLLRPLLKKLHLVPATQTKVSILREAARLGLRLCAAQDYQIKNAICSTLLLPSGSILDLTDLGLESDEAQVAFETAQYIEQLLSIDETALDDLIARSFRVGFYVKCVMIVACSAVSLALAKRLRLLLPRTGGLRFEGKWTAGLLKWLSDLLPALPTNQLDLRQMGKDFSSNVVFFDAIFRQWNRIEKLQVELGYKVKDEETLPILAKHLTELRSLIVHRADHGLMHLTRLTQLEELQLLETKSSQTELCALFAHMKSLQRLNFEGGDVIDMDDRSILLNGFGRLSHLTRFESTYFTSLSTDLNVNEFVKAFSNLVDLRLPYVRWTSVGISVLSREMTKLKHLTFDNSDSIDSIALPGIGSLSTLEHLSLRDVHRIDDNTLRQLDLPNLRGIYFRQNNSLTPNGIAQFLTSHSRLERLILPMPRSWSSAEVLTALCSLGHSMRKLSLANLRLSAEDVNRICSSLVQLDHLDLGYTGEQYATALRSLSYLSHLTYLDLTRSRADDSIAATLLTLSSLSIVCLKETKVTDFTVCALARMPQLKAIDLCDCEEVEGREFDRFTSLVNLQQLSIGGTGLMRNSDESGDKWLEKQRIQALLSWTHVEFFSSLNLREIEWVNDICISPS